MEDKCIGTPHCVILAEWHLPWVEFRPILPTPGNSSLLGSRGIQRGRKALKVYVLKQSLDVGAQKRFSRVESGP
jgi:hypothetical protein